MARITNIDADTLQDLVLQDTIYPPGTTDIAIDSGVAVPDNITSRSYECVIHRSLGDNLPLKSYTTGSGGGMTIPVGTDGIINTTIPLADILALGPGDYYYYIRRTDAGSAAVVSKGYFNIAAV